MLRRGVMAVVSAFAAMAIAPALANAATANIHGQCNGPNSAFASSPTSWVNNLQMEGVASQAAVVEQQVGYSPADSTLGEWAASRTIIVHADHLVTFADYTCRNGRLMFWKYVTKPADWPMVVVLPNNLTRAEVRTSPQKGFSVPIVVPVGIAGQANCSNPGIGKTTQTFWVAPKPKVTPVPKPKPVPTPTPTPTPTTPAPQVVCTRLNVRMIGATALAVTADLSPQPVPTATTVQYNWGDGTAAAPDLGLVGGPDQSHDWGKYGSFTITVYVNGVLQGAGCSSPATFTPPAAPTPPTVFTVTGTATVQGQKTVQQSCPTPNENIVKTGVGTATLNSPTFTGKGATQAAADADLASQEAAWRTANQPTVDSQAQTAAQADLAKQLLTCPAPPVFTATGSTSVTSYKTVTAPCPGKQNITKTGTGTATLNSPTFTGKGATQAAADADLASQEAAWKAANQATVDAQALAAAQADLGNQLQTCPKCPPVQPPTKCHDGQQDDGHGGCQSCQPSPQPPSCGGGGHDDGQGDWGHDGGSDHGGDQNGNGGNHDGGQGQGGSGW